jgi:type IV secretory pathway VirD2 relaxase
VARFAFIDRSRRDPHVFAIIVSPAGAKSMNLERYTQRFMEQLEDDLGTKLDYTFAIHRETPHPHAHIVILGHDEQGRDLYISRQYISHSMRHRAMEIAGRQRGLTVTPAHEQAQEKLLEQFASRHVQEDDDAQAKMPQHRTLTLEDTQRRRQETLEQWRPAHARGHRGTTTTRPRPRDGGLDNAPRQRPHILTGEHPDRAP